MPERCPGPPHRGHASSDWTCPIENAWTPTDHAVVVTQQLDTLWTQIKEKERELAIHISDPKFDKTEYKRQMSDYLRGKPL